LIEESIVGTFCDEVVCCLSLEQHWTLVLSLQTYIIMLKI
jgi:hypothetical protein